jgi:hypothetical protein
VSIVRGVATCVRLRTFVFDYIISCDLLSVFRPFHQVFVNRVLLLLCAYLTLDMLIHCFWDGCLGVLYEIRKNDFFLFVLFSPKLIEVLAKELDNTLIRMLCLGHDLFNSFKVTQ